MREYAVVFEKTGTGYSAFCPDLPGLAAAGADLAEARQMIGEALEFHIESLLLHDETVPEPTTRVATVTSDVVETWHSQLAKTA